MKTFIRAALVLLTLSSSALAETATAPQGPSGPARTAGPPQPPPEAVAACSGKAAGASCSFRHKDRDEQGTCFTPDATQAIACKPARPPRDAPPGGR